MDLINNSNKNYQETLQILLKK